MNAGRPDSEEILAWLERMGLEEPAAALLEAGRPLAVLAAQATYLLEPFVGNGGGLMRKLAALLEDDEQLTALTDKLRKESGS